MARLLPLLLLMMFQVVAHAQFTYTIFLGKVTITGYTDPGGAVTIPNTILGNPVVSIGDYAFYLNYSVTSVTIPSGVTSIGAPDANQIRTASVDMTGTQRYMRIVVVY